MPEHIKKKFKSQSGYELYVPERWNSKFFRFQIADFDPRLAEDLRDVTFDKLAEIKWMRRANVHATNNQTEFNRRTNGKGG